MHPSRVLEHTYELVLVGSNGCEDRFREDICSMRIVVQLSDNSLMWIRVPKLHQVYARLVFVH